MSFHKECEPVMIQGITFAWIYINLFLDHLCFLKLANKKWAEEKILLTDHHGYVVRFSRGLKGWREHILTA